MLLAMAFLNLYGNHFFDLKTQTFDFVMNYLSLQLKCRKLTG